MSRISWTWRLTLCWAFFWLGLTAAEEILDARSLEDNAFKSFANYPVAQTLGLLALKAQREGQQGNALKPAISIDKLKVPLPPGPPVNFFAGAPYLPLPSGPTAPIPPLGPTAVNWPYYMPHQEHYYHGQPYIGSYAKQPDVLAAIMKAVSLAPAKQVYPSFIIINPAHFGPYIQAQYNRPAGPSAYPEYARNAATPRPESMDLGVDGKASVDTAVEAEKPKASTEKSKEPENGDDGEEPIFMTAPALTGEEETLLADTFARSGSSGNALLELLLKRNQRRQMQEGIAAIYLRNYNANKK